MTRTTSDPIAIVFPGQASQYPGMGRLVHEHSEAARATFVEASEVTGVDIAHLCFDASAEDLSETTATQPAILTTSISIFRAMREKLAEVGQRMRPRLVGGHSLGLFSAAVATEAIGFRDSLLMIIERARLMGAFNRDRPVGMASIIGLDSNAVQEICEASTRSPDDRVDVANHNEEKQIVISGDVSALERAMERARTLQGRAIRLKLKVSSHTSLHTEQADEFAEVIRDIPIHDPRIPLLSNISSSLLTTAAEVRAEFDAQLKSPVRWADNMRRMAAEGIETVVEVGPGHTLSRMLKRAGNFTAISLDDAVEQPIPISVLPQHQSRQPAGS